MLFRFIEEPLPYPATRCLAFAKTFLTFRNTTPLTRVTILVSKVSKTENTQRLNTKTVSKVLSFSHRLLTFTHLFTQFYSLRFLLSKFYFVDLLTLVLR